MSEDILAVMNAQLLKENANLLEQLAATKRELAEAVMRPFRVDPQMVAESNELSSRHLSLEWELRELKAHVARLEGTLEKEKKDCDRAYGLLTSEQKAEYLGISVELMNRVQR
jgi:hypothetical protein